MDKLKKYMIILVIVIILIIAILLVLLKININNNENKSKNSDGDIGESIEITNKIEEMLAKINELGCDALQFKENIYQSNFPLYMQVNASFSEYFNDLKYTILVSVEIKDPGYAYGNL